MIQLPLFPSRHTFGPFCDRADCTQAQKHVETCDVMVNLRAYLREIRRKP